jgi:type IV pilus assembly protein PilN
VIKVNLLKEQGERVRKPAYRPTPSRSGILFAAIFIVVVAAVAGYWYYLQHNMQTLTETRDRLRTDNARLLQWKKEIAEFEKLKKLRERRIQIIEQLKQSQTGPVTLLNQVIASMPKDNTVWLTLLDQKSERVQIGGFTLRNEALPDFMTNLMATGYFKTVDLELFEEAKDKDAARFSLICTSAAKPVAE